ncbi:hypothetical protein FRC03_010828 [Tulasnella sp. 419]|nr:hypothetical protein FRC03_010828 [Tulasnella sp. 419]
MPPSLSDLPYDVLIDHLLPILPVQSLLSLTCTSKYFAGVCTNTLVWKRRLQSDFNFSASDETARVKGFKVIYEGLQKPKVYVWGESTRGRLGLDPESLDDSQSVPCPTELKLNARIISMVSGGWSFHALDDTGAIWVWGTMFAETAARSPPEDPWFSEPGSTAWKPLKLVLPTRFIGISCGRRVSAALDSRHRVWMFTRWGRANLLTFTGGLTDPYPHPKISQTTIIQVECGWGHTTFLTDDGRVFAIWPRSGAFAHQEALKNGILEQDGDGHPARAENGVIRSVPVEISAEPLELPPLPDNLPHLRTMVDAQAMESTAYTAPKLVKIASGDSFVIGLTDQGHVLCIDLMGADVDDGIDNLRAMFLQGERQWVYLPDYCDIRDVVTDPVYAPGEDGTVQVKAPKELHITHISAHFNYFVAYSPGASSTVLMSFIKREAASLIDSFDRKIYPRLQNEDVILVVLGDYHFGALHGDGSLSTWGAYSKGAVGLGDPFELPVGAPGGYATQEALDRARERNQASDLEPPRVERPSRVRFDWDNPGRKRFCFSVAASGWHTGALVIDLHDDHEDQPTPPTDPEKKEETKDTKDTKESVEENVQPRPTLNPTNESGWKKWKKLMCGCFGDTETTV